MNDDERRAAKRSRFDQTEPPEAKRSSRFDRRSRSPSAKESRARRSRSPLGRGSSGPFSPASEDKKSGADPAAAAAAAAARINAQIQAKRGIQHVDVPPIRSASSDVGKSASPPASSNINGDVYVADGDYIKDIEVNDLRNRYTLTKGSTQKMIKEETGADVTTRGSYYPDKSMASPSNPPLYLHITSTSKDGLEQAIAKVEELMKQELPNLVDERRFRRREPEQVERDEFGRRKWPEERIPIDLEPVQGFNLRAQVVGHGGAYVKHIQQETRCRVQIKGRGSGFMEHGTGQESDEPMYLHVAGPDPKEVQHAKELCEDLLGNVKQQYEQFKERPPQQNYGGYGGYQQGGHDRGGYGGGYGGYQQSNSPAPPGSAMSPMSQGPPGTPAAAAPGAAGATDYSAQWAQYYGASGADPYAAYGGYENYVKYYQYYYGQQAGQQQPQQPAAPGAAPPPPPSEAPPPPPPSGSPPGASGGFNAVPPPPGM
ncbi:MAG: hypothetical protein M1833_005291 [Piccolia ochrophora]|nr:MAG: hypothetical protein M1833_005291 [Piccolia ochrophora]